MGDFSFEDIHELLRAEKYSTDLQPLPAEHLASISKYLDSKEELLQKQTESQLFDKSARDKLRDEIDSAQQAVKEFYEKREKKVITRAVYTARSGFKMRDTTNMLKSEEQLYGALVELLKKGLSDFFSQLDSGIQTASEHLKNKEEASVSANSRLLKFTDAVPELLDSELKKYGPFTKDQVAELPAELAELLLKQVKAVDVKAEN